MEEQNNLPIPTINPLSQRQLLAAFQLALGKHPKEVAKMVGLVYESIIKWKSNPLFRLAIQEATREIKGRMIDNHEETIKKRLEDTFEPSLQLIESTRDGVLKSVKKLESGEEEIGVGPRLTAAKFLVEQVIGTSVSRKSREENTPQRAIINLPPQLAKVLVQAIAEDDGKPVPIDITEESDGKV